ncbi:nuclear transport factor 2 family protein [Streptomyces hainanensis]|uniref:Nuclear transport factor 2 family protein n=1 Tax=Streptomyces hainanensis TaxID=402648 RepID=A0A4R4T9R8_9ACTN|nr:nuclear transport factor 2 family protein [Streptomyces hainanensis]TDC73857.1 nuclear transport factor 2 family protein [Streptomyces hainanensis]
MSPFTDTDPKQFIADFYASFHNDLLGSDEDPGLIVDRYHTPDVVQVADGHWMDRDKLVAHTRPVRKNRPSGRWDVHDALVSGDRIAARFTLYVTNRTRDLAIESHMFAQFTDDGRMRQAHILTRTLPADAGPGQPMPEMSERQVRPA